MSYSQEIVLLFDQILFYSAFFKNVIPKVSGFFSYTLAAYIR